MESKSIKVSAQTVPWLFNIMDGKALYDLRTVMLYQGKDYHPTDGVNQFDYFEKDEDGLVRLDQNHLPVLKDIDELEYSFDNDTLPDEYKDIPDITLRIKVLSSVLIPHVDGELCKFGVLFYLGGIVGLNDYEAFLAWKKAELGY